MNKLWYKAGYKVKLVTLSERFIKDWYEHNKKNVRIFMSIEEQKISLLLFYVFVGICRM